ncbi:outer membrane protein TolC [Mariniflexile fucanivorans]|uniref:Outer membrane protein TolC n=2 Tax=Mariniflexile fucanivorans TaxID=264023 RepID=A0A4R1RG43_9FLAO|nr:outer membrane protein TolC [Mariniflexile fucanivorans]
MGSQTFNFNVEEAVTYAVDHNITLSKSKIDQDIIAAQIAEVKAAAFPQISATGGFTDNFSLAEQQLPAEIVGGEPGTTVGVAFGNRYAFTGGVRAEQQLLNFQLFNSIKAAKALNEIQALATLQTTEDLIINVVQVYIQIQVTEKQVQLLEENFNRTNSLINLSDLKYKEGIIKKLDLNQLKVNRSNLRTQIEDAQYQMDEQKRLFKLYLYIPMDAEVNLTEKLEDNEAFPLQNNLDLHSNIQYQQLEKQVDLSILDQKVERANYLPKISAFFNYNYQGNTNEFTFDTPPYTDQWNGTYGLSATLNVFDGGARRKRIQQKQLETLKLEEDQKMLKTSIEKDYQDALQQMLLSQSQITSQNENMQLAYENYTGINTSYKEGVADLTELLDSEFALRQAQSNYLNALLQSKIATLRILKTSGQLAQLISKN